MNYQELLAKIERAPELDFGDLFSNAIELFKKVWLQGFLLQLIVMLVSYGVLILLYIPLLGGVFVLGGAEGDFESASGLGGVVFGVLMMFLYIAVILAVQTLSLGLQAAFFRISRVKERGLDTEQGVNFGMFLRKPYLKKVLVLALAQLGIMLLASAACFLPLLYVIVPIQFSILIFAFHPELSVSDIISASFKLGNKKWLLSFGLLIVSGLLAIIVGMIACGIGVLFTAAFVYLPQYLIYKEVVGFTETTDAIDQLGS